MTEPAVRSMAAMRCIDSRGTDTREVTGCRQDRAPIMHIMSTQADVAGLHDGPKAPLAASANVTVPISA